MVSSGTFKKDGSFLAQFKPFAYLCGHFSAILTKPAQTHRAAFHAIEEKILRLHQTKRDLADSLLEGTDMSHKISAAELLKMIGNGW